MDFTNSELKIMERLLQNRLNADYDPDVAALHQKVTQALAAPKSNVNAPFRAGNAPIRSNY